MRGIDVRPSSALGTAARSSGAASSGGRGGRRETVLFPARFEGPPGAANGGIVVAALAAALGPRVEVTLRRPSPLETLLRLELEEGPEGPRATLHDPACEDEAGLLAEGRRVALRLPIPVAPDFEEAREARAAMDEAAHPFPRCFVCGPERRPGEGLRLTCGPLHGWGSHRAVAAPFVPDGSLADRHGFVEARYVWAALDCPGALAALEGERRPLLLGRMTAALEGRPRPAERCVAVGWQIARSGRKHETGTALLGAGGRVLGRARQIWIAPR